MIGTGRGSGIQGCGSRLNRERTERKIASRAAWTGTLSKRVQRVHFSSLVAFVESVKRDCTGSCYHEVWESICVGVDHDIGLVGWWGGSTPGVDSWKGVE